MHHWYSAMLCFLLEFCFALLTVVVLFVPCFLSFRLLQWFNVDSHAASYAYIHFHFAVFLCFDYFWSCECEWCVNVLNMWHFSFAYFTDDQFWQKKYYYFFLYEFFFVALIWLIFILYRYNRCLYVSLHIFSLQTPFMYFVCTY